MRKILKILALLFLLFGVYSLLNICCLDEDVHLSSGYFESGENVTINSKSVVAAYGYDGDSIFLQRILVEHPFKYQFYSSKHYTDGFSVSEKNLTNCGLSNCDVLSGDQILVGKKGTISMIRKVPEFLTIKRENGFEEKLKKIELKQEAVESTPEICFWEKLTLGPFFERIK